MKIEQNLIPKIKQGIKNPQIIENSLRILRKNSKPDEFLFSHSLRTGLILREMGVIDEETLAGGILHHFPEPLETAEDFPSESKKEILNIIKKANRLRELFASKKSFKPKSIKKWQKIFLDVQAENLRRMIFALTRDLRPIFVLLAGRLDEMRNLESFPESYQKKDYQRKKSIEALEILAPLAYGVGMGEVKGQLEDLAFPRLYPKQYKWLRHSLKTAYLERKKQAEKAKPYLMKMLNENEIKVKDIHARAKHYFSLYQKLLRYNMEIEKIYDLVALRVIVPDIESCYQSLGIIHHSWAPLPGRIKDYIASPKPNGYRSLHTTVDCPFCKTPLEIQIKTEEMHKEAEYGVAAHLGYKERIPQRTYKYQFYWMDQLRKWREELKDPKKVASLLESELFKDRVFVFTPKGDIFNLPKGATAVDFAYAVHTEIGDHCDGAKVNGKLVPLNYVLKTSETVEILTNKNKTPSSDWLRFVKTAKARSKIKNFLQKAYGFSPEKPRKKSFKENISLIKKILPIRKERKPKILIGGQVGISVKLSKCCSPQPGEKISAFITKGEGASIHKIDCLNLKELKQKWPQRITEAKWINIEDKKKTKS